MSTHPVRKFLQNFGLDIHRYRPVSHKLIWLRDLKIRTVIDVGANVGQFASEIRSLLPQAFIYSFEPLPECYDKLVKNMSNDKDFKAFNIALGDKTGEVNFFKSSYPPSLSLLPMAKLHKQAFPHSSRHEEVKVRVEMLDNFKLNLLPEILVKIDVQGYEERVIEGGGKTIVQAKIVIIETSFYELYEGQPLFGEIYSQLTGLGFAYHGNIGAKPHRKTKEVLFEDAVFIKE